MSPEVILTFALIDEGLPVAVYAGSTPLASVPVVNMTPAEAVEMAAAVRNPPMSNCLKFFMSQYW
jgi:hypothetical protein